MTNEPAVSENTSVKPATRPGTLSGNVTRRKTFHHGAPSVRAASSRLRIDLAQRRGQRQHHHREEDVQRADDHGGLGIEERQRLAVMPSDISIQLSMPVGPFARISCQP